MGLRILHAIRSVNPAGGGPMEGILQISAVNRRHGHEIEVVSLDPPAAPWIRSCPIKCHALGPPILGYGYSPKFVPWLKLHRRDYDVVVVNGIWQYNAFGVWRALRGTATPYVVFTHGMLDPWFKRRYPLKHLKKWLYWPWADYRVLRDATAVLFTCEEERRLARQSFWLYHCDECVVNYGTAGPKGDSVAQKRVFLERYPELRGKRCILFLGRVHEKKGPDLLFRAFDRVIRELPIEQTSDVHLVMAGPHDHSYGRSMKKLSRSLGLEARVTWTGMLTGDQKWGAFYAADAFILPSHQENFGIAVAESLGCGTPVLLADKVNIAEDIAEDKAGLMELDTQDGTANLLKRWIALSAEERTAMSRRAIDCFHRRYDMRENAKAIIRLFETATEHSQVPTPQ
jgi:glycosyltransferase involved in cell wall biosynthesis